jgi:D-alanyl-D-alanine endopeptidase (penicillin-binding protein 7)
VWSIASLSKMMAILVVVEAGLNLADKTVLTDSDWALASGGSRTRLKRKIPYPNVDLLHAALLGSDNRAVLALGRAVGLNAQALTAKMNARASAMGLKNTTFTDPTGIAHENVSTASEVARILKAASDNKLIAEVMRKVTYTVIEKPSNRQIVYNNTNILTRETGRRKVVAGKTGFNSSAGYCVATLLELPGYGTVSFVVLGSSGMYQRFADVQVLVAELESLREKEARSQQARTPDKTPAKTPAKTRVEDRRRIDPVQPKDEKRSRSPASK